jgi:hypothetical protein
MSDLEALDKFNERKRKEFDSRERFVFNIEPRKNGIACPECGKELFDTDPGSILTSEPPQSAIHCKCGFYGYRFG